MAVEVSRDRKHGAASDGTLSAFDRDEERSSGEHQHAECKQYQRCVDSGNEVPEEEHYADEQQNHPDPEPSCSTEHPLLVRPERA